MELQAYWPLVLILLLPLVWLAARESRSDLTHTQLLLSASVRSVFHLLLVLALTRPLLVTSGGWISAIYLVDVSESIPKEEIRRAARWISEAEGRHRPQHSRVVLFGRSSIVLDDVRALLDSAGAVPELEGPPGDGTDLESALERARHLFAPHHLKRLVLFSDANENSGRAVKALPRLRRSGVRLFAVPPQERSDRDCWVERIRTPEILIAHEPAEIEVDVYCRSQSHGTVFLEEGGEPLATRTLELPAGLNRVSVEAAVDGEGARLLEARIRVGGDAFAGNDRFPQAVVLQSPPRVLYLEGHNPSRHYLQNALEAEGIHVESASATRLPRAPQGLEEYDLVLLSDIPARELEADQMRAVANWVGDSGGSLLLLGGQATYGEEGYRETPLEEILPLDFTVRRRREDLTVALAIVLDKSGSMRGEKMELAKSASQAAVRILNESDRVGVLAFDYSPYWVVELQEAGRRESIRRQIGTITAAGETNIYPALETAFRALDPVAARVKHVLLLSDGRSLPENYQSLVTRMKESKVSVSTVAVGGGADRDLLANMARWGGGRFYFTEDAGRVPEIFLQEIQRAARPTLAEQRVRARLRKNAEAFKGIEWDGAPPLLGYVRMGVKDTAEVLLESEQGDPLLARWQYGLGKTAVFTSDAKDRWAAQWLNWNGYERFWVQLVRETARTRFRDAFHTRMELEGAGAELQVEAVDRRGRFLNGLDLEAEIIDAPSGPLRLEQVAPGRYRTRLAMADQGPRLLQLRHRDRVVASHLLAGSYPAEYRFYPPNVELLETLSAETRGALNPGPEQVFAPDESTAKPTSLWQLISAAALVFYLVDIFLRRVPVVDREPRLSVLTPSTGGQS